MFTIELAGKGSIDCYLYGKVNLITRDNKWKNVP